MKVEKNQSLNVLMIDKNSIGFYSIKALLYEHINVEKVDKISQFNQDIIIDNKYDIILWNISEDSCLNVIRDFQLKNPGSKILAINTGKELINSIEYYEAGVKGYLNLSCSQDKFIESVMTIMNGDTVISDNDMTTLLNSISKQKIINDCLSTLSKKEKVIMQHLCEGLTVNKIATLLKLHTNTISTLKIRIQKKLAVNNVVELVNFRNKLISV